MSEYEPFVMVPHAYVKAPISDRAFRLFAVLAIYRNNDTGLAWPGLATLAAVMGCSVSSVRRAREELETIGAIDSKQRWNATTVYNVNVSSPLTRALTGGNKSVTGETKSVTGENKSVTGEQLTRTIKLEPINLIDPKASGIAILKTQLLALVDSGWGAGNYAPTNNYGNPLEELTEAIRVDPDGVEKKLKKKTTTAANLAPYIDEILKTNPWVLLPDYWSDMDTEPAKTSPPEARTAPKTSSVGTSAPAPVKPAQRPPVFDGVSAPNMAWLGSHPTDYELRCAALADELGLTIPGGVDAPQAGQLLAAARDMKAAGEVLENPTSEQWQGRAPLKTHRVKVSD